jgi:hypothetical protein
MDQLTRSTFEPDRERRAKIAISARYIRELIDAASAGREPASWLALRNCTSTTLGGPRLRFSPSRAAHCRKSFRSPVTLSGLLRPSLRSIWLEPAGLRQARLLNSRTLWIRILQNEPQNGPAKTLLSAGAPEEIRTPDPQIRSLVLYPAELRARFSLTFQGARPAIAACYRTDRRKVAKARHSYRLGSGLARSGQPRPE